MTKLRSTALAVLTVGLAWLAVSCASTSPDVDTTPTLRTNVDAHVGKSMTADGKNVDNITDKFAPGETVYAAVDVPGKIEGNLRVRWMRGSEQIGEETIRIDEDVNVYVFQMAPANGANPAGQYSLEIYVNDNRAEVERFTVQ